MLTRRLLASLTGSALLLALAGCENEPKPSTTATVFNKERVHESMKALVDAVEALESTVEEFDTTNWREVVPQVRDGVSEVSSTVDALRTELGYEG